MADTLADLWREVRTDRSAALQLAETARPRRPLPRTMRTPEARAADPRLADAERQRAFAQMEMRRQANADTLQRQAQGRGQNQFAELGPMALEVTGHANALRANQALRESDYRTAAAETALGLLNLGTLGLGGRPGPRVPRPLPPSMRAGAMQYRSQVGPGSFDDIMRSRQPFMRPEADYAAAMTPPSWNEGRLFHGSSANIEGPLRPSRHPSLPEPTAVSLTPNPNIAAQFGDTIYPVQTRGMTLDGERFMARARELQDQQGLSVEQASAQAQREFEGIGYRGIRWGDREVAMFRSEDIRPAIGRPDPEAPPRITPPAREIGPGGLPIAQARPFRQSFVGGTQDLTEAARPGNPRPDPHNPRDSVGADMSRRPMFPGRGRP